MESVIRMQLTEPMEEARIREQIPGLLPIAESKDVIFECVLPGFNVEVGLAVKIVIDRSHVDPCALANLRYRGSMVALLSE